MPLNPADLYHTGIVVDDFEEVRTRLTRTLGYEWGADIQIEQVVQLPSGPITIDHRLQYSVTEPRLELVRTVKGSPFEPSDAAFHHIGYWSADIEAALAEMVDDGWTKECWGDVEVGTLAWVYLRGPQGIRVELVSEALKPYTQEAMFCPVAGLQ